MKEQLISFDTAKLAKEKGFIHKDRQGYSVEGNLEGFNKNNYPAPTQSLLQKWLYETYTIWVKSTPMFNANEVMGVEVIISSWKFPYKLIDYDGYDVYEALEKGLQEALKLI